MRKLHEKIETANTKHKSNKKSVDENVLLNHIKNGSKELESKCIEKLISQNFEIKNIILKVIFFDD